jgi:hypothetical protein
VTIGEYELTKSGDSFWTVRTKPLAPGLHRYSVLVDGFNSTDPGSQTFFGALWQSSRIEIPGPESDFFAPQDVPHGGAHRVYFSKSTDRWRRILFIRPPNMT